MTFWELVPVVTAGTVAVMSVIFAALEVVEQRPPFVALWLVTFVVAASACLSAVV